MPFDATKLYWPAFKDLYDRLEGINLEPDAVDVSSLTAILKNYIPSLNKGLRVFQSPNDASKKAIENETSLKAGNIELPIEAGLRQAALAASSALNLDQVQAYILVHRWLQQEGTKSATPPQLLGGRLSPDQLRDVSQMYSQERLRLLKSIEALLLLGEGWSGVGDFVDAVENALSELLGASPGLEDVTYRDLKDNLEGKSNGGVSNSSLGLITAGGSGGNDGAVVVVAGMTATRSGRSAAAEEFAALERNVMLSILGLIYFHPRKQCTPERFLELARLFHVGLFRLPLGDGVTGTMGSSSAGTSPSHLSVKLATLLLLEVLTLDAEKALQAVATGEAVNESVNAFLAPSIQSKLDSELRTWFPGPAVPHSAILLAWAAILTLAGRHTDAAPHATRATEAGALGALRDLSSPQGLQPAAADMGGTIVYSTVCTVLTAFGLDPCSMAPQQAQQAVDMLCNIFSHHPSLCDSFWTDQNALTNQPISHFLDSLADLFPAYPLPMLRLLTALAAGTGPSAAAAAYFYLNSNTTLTWLHELPHPAISVHPGDPTAVLTTDEIDLPGADGLTLYTNVTGDVLPIDPETGVCAAWPVWAPGADPTSGALHAVRWRLPSEADTRPWALLCRAFDALRTVQPQLSNGSALAGVNSNPPAAVHTQLMLSHPSTNTNTHTNTTTVAALLELEATLGFLAALCCGDPGSTAIHVLRFEAPAIGVMAMETDVEDCGRDVIALACQTITALASAPLYPSTSPTTLTHCFKLCSAFTPAASGRVADQLLGALGITPLDMSMAARASGSPPDAPVLRQLLAAEGALGRYPATHALLNLLISLLQAACPAPSLATLVSFVVQRIAPELNHWRFEDQAERWQLAERCLTVMRQALIAAPCDLVAAAASGGAADGECGPIAGAVIAVLQSESGTAACLLPLLPPDASALEAQSNSVDYWLESQVEAAEKCCVAWLRLVPVLLPPWDTAGTAHLAPGAFLRSPVDGGNPAAATLLSFLAYPFFASREIALVVRAMHCFIGAATATGAPPDALVLLLPQDGTYKGVVAAAAKRALAHALETSMASSCSSLFGATCDVLAAAVARHPSLANALFFDAGLDAANGKENKKVNDISSYDLKREGIPTSTPPPAATNCLDALWLVLDQWEALYDQNPYAVAKALQVVAALWQAGNPVLRAVTSLHQRPGFWAAVIGILKNGAKEGALVAPSEGDEEAPGKWNELLPSCWRIVAEEAALQILTAECFIWRNTLNPSTDPGSAKVTRTNGSTTAAGNGTAVMPAEVSKFASSGLYELVPSLVQRYCLVLPTTGLQRDTYRLAAATAAQVLEATMVDQTLWPSARTGVCLVSQLASLAQTELNRYQSPEQAAGAVSELGTAVLGPNGADVLETRPVVRNLARGLLTQAEVPPRLANDAEYGPSYLYDSLMLGRRVGVALSQEARMVGDLQTWVAAMSVASGVEDARGDAAAALDALATVADAVKQRALAADKTRLQLGGNDGSVIQHQLAALNALESVIQGVVGCAIEAQTRGRGTDQISSSGAVVGVNADVLRIPAASAAAQIALIAVRCSDKASAASDGVYTVAERALSLAAKWLDATSMLSILLQDTAKSSQDREAVGEVSRGLLALALHCVSILQPATALTSFAALNLESSAAQQAQQAAQGLLPSLLTIVAEGSEGTGPAEHAGPGASLSAAMLERLLPPSVWLPILSHYLHFGRTLGTALNHLSQGSSTSDDSSALEALFTLALQVTQIPQGARLLADQGLPSLLLSLSAWLQAPPPGGNLLDPGIAAGPAGPSPRRATPPVDYGNAYSSVDGSQALPHRLWCSMLSLVGLLTAALPTSSAVMGPALQLAVGMDPRLQLAIDPPEGSAQQPVTLAMSQEARYALFLAWGVSNIAGQWRVALPHALPALRRASASLLQFLAEPVDGVVCVPVSAAEKSAAKLPAPVSVLTGGWFGVPITADDGQIGGTTPRNAATNSTSVSTSSSPCKFTWELAEQLYSCVQYALAFQLAVAPEVSEAEAEALGPEWPSSGTLRVLCEQCIEIIDPVCAGTYAADVNVRRVLRTMVAILKASSQMLELVAPKEAPRLVREADAAVERAQALLATHAV